MERATTRRYPISAWASLFAVAAALIIANAGSAQMTGGGGGGGGRGGGPRDPGGDTSDDRATGSASGWIMKYTGPKKGDPEDVLAYFTVKPATGRPVKLLVLRDDPVMIELGDRKDFEPEEYADVLIKGLYCKCTWKVTDRKKNPDDKKTKKINVLSRVTFDSLEVTGKLEEIGDDLVVIKGKPINDHPWPDAPPKKDSPRGDKGNVKPKVSNKKLKLRVFDDVTKYKDSANQAIEPADFELKQDVTAMVVYGRRGGIVIDLKSPIKKEGHDDGGDDRDGRGGGKPGM